MRRFVRGIGRAIGVMSVIGMVTPAFADPITLAANLHDPTESQGNNHYSDGGTVGNGAIGAENFTLGGRFEITGLSHVGHHARGSIQPDSVDWSIYEDNHGLPGAVIYAGTAAPRRSIEGRWTIFDLTRYSIDLTGVTLGAGEYWVGFHNNSRGEGDPHWTFATSGSSFDDRSALLSPGGNWELPYPGSNLTFAVEGNPAPVPEPGTMLLVASGIAAVAARRRRARASSFATS